MNDDVRSFLGNFFSLIWNMLGSVTIPGTSINGQVALVAPLGAMVFITAMKKITDMGGVSSSSLSTFIGSATVRGGSSSRKSQTKEGD